MSRVDIQIPNVSVVHILAHYNNSGNASFVSEQELHNFLIVC